MTGRRPQGRPVRGGRPSTPARPVPTVPVRPAAGGALGPRAVRRAEPGVVLFVDRIVCDGYGTCAELLPEMISLDEWGYPIVSKDLVLPSLMSYARKAVDSCPVLALRLADPARVTIAPPRPAGPNPVPAARPRR
jgi:ferredoxin